MEIFYLLLTTILFTVFVLFFVKDYFEKHNAKIEVTDEDIETALEKMEMPIDSNPRNWIEDFVFDNGKYANRCVECEFLFLGHKRRPYCKVCASGE